jgi:hypothetical protein
VIPIQLPNGLPVVVETPAPGSVTVDFNLDIDGDSISDFRLQSYLGTNIRSLSNPLSLNEIITDYMTFDVRFLSAGEMIDDNLTIDNGFEVLETYAEFDNFIDTRGFVGVQFDIPGGSPHFAYLDIGVDQPGNKLTLYGGAYESESGVGIEAGAIPEPSGLGLLAMGAAGLATWRRKSYDRI